MPANPSEAWQRLETLGTSRDWFQATPPVAWDRLQSHPSRQADPIRSNRFGSAASARRTVRVKAENARLRAELGVLRSAPLPSTSSSSDGAGAALDETVTSLTLSLRRVSAKLLLTESALAEHTLALTQPNTLAEEKSRAAHEAYALAVRTRGREGVLRIDPERAVREKRVKGEMSERGRWGRMRNRSGRPTAAQTTDIPASALASSRSQLSALSLSFTASSTALEKRVFALESELGIAEAKLTAARALNAELGEALAEAKFEGRRHGWRIKVRRDGGELHVSVLLFFGGLVSSFSLHPSTPAFIPAFPSSSFLHAARAAMPSP
ncbi:hypothetical protein FB451DRAFT_1178888 [Mycena latifolia]|nr:hypothetical protein FB451DRAFT_1178888 [Mycena latifolia]